MLSTSVVTVALLAGSAIAQVANYTYVNPDAIEPQVAASWCIGERTGCSALCDGNAPTNDCDAQKLTFSCLCSNGSTPNLADYKNTMPDFLCQEDYAGCIKAHPDDAIGQGKCKTDIQSHCGFLNVTDYKSGSSSGSGSGSGDNSGSSTESPSPSETGGSGSGGSGEPAKTTESAPTGTKSSNTAATSSSAAMALANGKDFGVGVLAAGLLAAFGYML